MAEKKNVYLRIRTDGELKQALKARADQEDRNEMDQARHILRIGLGLTEAGRTPIPSLEHLPIEVQATVERLIQALTHGPTNVQEHLIAQLKVVEEAVEAARAKKTLARRRKNAVH